MKCLYEDVPAFQHTQDVHLVAALLVTYARWWVCAPEDQLKALRALRTNSKPEVELCGMTEGNRCMLRHFKDRDLARQLLVLPELIRARYVGLKAARSRDHDDMESAAMAALLLATAIRPKNAATARIGVNVIERNGRMIYQAPASEVKNKVPLEFMLPETAAAVLRTYIQRARPHLVTSNDSDCLFPGAKGGHITIGYFGQKVGDFVERMIGVRVTGHRFRHVCGFLYLQDNPNGYEVVRLLLGHKKISTTIRYYAGAEVDEAHQRFDDFMSRRRDEIDFGEQDDMPAPKNPSGGRRRG